MLRSGFRGALIGAVVGDALGAPFEGHPGPISVEQVGRAIGRGSRFSHTDDAALTLALAEALIDSQGLDLDRVAESFARTYAADPARGYGAAAAQILSRVSRGADWRTLAPAQFAGQGSFGNGAAMRVSPIALLAYPEISTAVLLGRDSAVITHTHPEAIDAAGIQAAAVALALTAAAGVDRFDIAQLLPRAETPALQTALAEVRNLDPSCTPGDVVKVTGNGLRAAEAVPAALAAALLNSGSFGHTIEFAVAMGGDTDTIASMAGAVAGARLGENAIPKRWRECTEGVDRARNLADRLWRRKYDTPAALNHGSV